MNRIQTTLTLLFCLTGSAWAQVNINPNAMDFGVVQAGTQKSLGLQIQNTTAFEMTVTAQQPGAPFLLNSTSLIVPAQQVKNFTVTVPANAAAGTFNSQILLRFEIRRGSSQLIPPTVVRSLSQGRQIAIKAIVAAGRPEFQPNLLDFGTVPPGQSKTLTVHLKNPLSTPLSCTSNVSTGQFQGGPSIQVPFSVSPPTVTIPPNSQAPISVTFSPSDQDRCTASNATQFPQLLAYLCTGVSGQITFNAKGKTNPFNRVAFNFTATDANASVRVEDPLDICVSPSQRPFIGGCAPPGQGGGAFGSTVATSGGCSGANVIVGHTVTIRVLDPLAKFQQFTQGSGPASACNGRTTNSCSFTATQPSSLLLHFAP